MDSPGPSDLRPLTLTLAALLWLAPLPARAEEPVLARVQSVDEDAVTLMVEDESGAPLRSIRLAPPPGGLPEDLRPGGLVRLWPGSADPVSGALTGARIAPIGIQGMERDRTGVRSRLSRGAGQGPGRMGGHGGR